MMWMFQVFMLAMFGTSILMFGNKFLSSIASVNLNGNSMDDIEGSVTQKVTQGAGLITGIAAGGVGASAAGGSILKGAAMGGMTGARGGKPATAALLGMAAGRAQGSRGRAKRLEKEQSKEHWEKMESDPVYAAQYEAEEGKRGAAQIESENFAMDHADVSPENLGETADKWEKWAKDNKDASGKPRLIPMPTDPKLKEALEKRGMEFRTRQEAVIDEVHRQEEEHSDEFADEIADELNDAPQDESWQDHLRNNGFVFDPVSHSWKSQARAGSGGPGGTAGSGQGTAVPLPVSDPQPAGSSTSGPPSGQPASAPPGAGSPAGGSGGTSGPADAATIATVMANLEAGSAASAAVQAASAESLRAAANEMTDAARRTGPRRPPGPPAGS
jgi:hypothetical protein